MKTITEKYIEDVLRTEPSVEDYEKIIARIDVKTMRLLHAAMGLCTEAGEFMDQIKKHIMYGAELDEINLVEELGDGNWYEGIALDTLMFSMAEVLHRNIAKLKARFPEKFSQEGALNRNLDNEKEALQQNEILVSKTIGADSIHYREFGWKLVACGLLKSNVSYSNNINDVNCKLCKEEMVRIHFDRMQ